MSDIKRNEKKKLKNLELFFSRKELHKPLSRLINGEKKDEEKHISNISNVKEILMPHPGDTYIII